MRNDLATLRFAHKENDIFIRMSVVQRSEDNSAFCVLHSALKIKNRDYLDEEREKGEFSKGCCSRPTAPLKVLVLVKYSAKMRGALF